MYGELKPDPWPRGYNLEWFTRYGRSTSEVAWSKWKAWRGGVNHWGTELYSKKVWMVCGSAEEAREEPGSWVTIKVKGSFFDSLGGVRTQSFCRECKNQR